MVFGMLLALSLYNLLVAQSTRDNAYLFYGLYLFALAISLLGLMDPYASYLNQFFLPDHPALAMWVKRVSDPVAWILLLLFDRAFLEMRRYLPTWDKVFIAMAVLVALWDLSGIFPWYNELDNAFTRAFGWVADVQNHVLVLMGVIAGIIRYRQGFEPAKYFVAAQIILAIATNLQLHPTDSPWNPLHYLPDGAFWRYVTNEQLWIGAAIEAIIFSMGLSHRINLLRATVARQTLEAEQERKRVAIEHKERLEVEVAERTQELRAEKENADRLLHNILPVDVADELIANGSTQPQRYEEVSILYTDFKGFTNAVASLPAKRVVEELNDIFQHFDDIIDACGIEKIKTIGDAYMIAGGLPRPLPDHAERCVDTALRMLAYIEERNKTSALKWSMRAGIHSGAVVAGVVGKRKFTYDVWGDTVNIASRMESAGEPGRVNVSAYTYDLVKSKYKGEYRGKLDAKGKGEIDMYFVLP
jgi:class 3 adenylate cyclase